MGEFQNLKHIEGLEMSSVSADLYGNGRDDLALFIFQKARIMRQLIQQIQLLQSQFLGMKILIKKLLKL